MSIRDSALPELVWNPTHAGYGDDETARLKDFRRACREGLVECWTCKKAASLGDVYLFWFGKPVQFLAGIGVVASDVDELTNDGWDWTDAKRGWFCDYSPLIELKEPLTIRDISTDRKLVRWWKGRPFQGRPKRIMEVQVASHLAELILIKNPKNRSLARHLQLFKK